MTTLLDSALLHKNGILFVSILSLVACAGPAPTHIVVTQPLVEPMPEALTYSFASKPDANSANSFDIAIRESIAQRIPGKQIFEADKADILISYGFSERDSSTEIVDRSSAKKQRFLGRCVKYTVRLTINIVGRTDGRLFYSASAEEHHCKPSIQDAYVNLTTKLLPEGTWPDRSMIVR